MAAFVARDLTAYLSLAVVGWLEAGVEVLKSLIEFAGKALWPAVLITLVLLFRKQIEELLQSMSEGDFELGPLKARFVRKQLDAAKQAVELS